VQISDCMQWGYCEDSAVALEPVKTAGLTVICETIVCNIIICKVDIREIIYVIYLYVRYLYER
jgi:hypothetical protein